MNGRFSGKVALVTGGAEGIGKATAHMLASGGAAVAILDISGDRAQEAADAIRAAGGEAEAFTVDVTDDGAVASAVDAVVAKWGRLTSVFNNAGTCLDGDGAIPDIDPATWDRTFKLNVGSVFTVCRHALPHLQANGSGAIVNTSSVAALRPERVYDAYTASKGAVISLTLSMAQHWAASQIRVNAIVPGPIETALTREAFNDAAIRTAVNAHIPMGRIGQADEVAAVASFLLSDDASFVTGTVMPVDGGWVLSD